MSRLRNHWLSGLAALLAAAIGIGAPVLRGASAGGGGLIEDEGIGVRRVTVIRYKSRTFELHRPFDTAVVGSPDIADVMAMSNRVLYIQGKKVGTTNVSLFDTNKQLIGVFDVAVTIDAGNIAEKIRSSTSSPGIRVTSSNEQVVLTGMAANAVDAERAVAIAKAVAPEIPVVNLMQVAPSQQVLLKVRFIEANRETGRDLGVNWFGYNDKGTAGVTTGQGRVDNRLKSPLGSDLAGGTLPLFQAVNTFAGSATGLPFGVALANVVSSGGANIDLLITALETRGLARRLAEPDLVALSGDMASFLAGGEIPVPVVQPGSAGVATITVEYKPFGVQLTFVPTVLANGVINLRLTPSVSQLDYANAIRNQGFLIPALTKREARTTIELRDGQSFAIAGLLQTQGTRDISQIPWLGSLPVIGTLFRSTAYQQQETDLVVIVTPHLVQPVAPGQRLATPLDDRLPSNDGDLFWRGELDVPKKYTEYVTTGRDIVGPYGHIILQDRK
ncbi:MULTISPECIES: type II and III secretion system protein family protein [Rhodomicrobium]|uniref:type II and III secretion system protein family protein n=1 Tax=Rhodomicrobium TaxID=1068 RepID=UPI000B4B13E7|nr:MULTISPECIES: type II and III secretion system protein family protein [Rhodomicrobium]